MLRGVIVNSYYQIELIKSDISFNLTIKQEASFITYRNNTNNDNSDSNSNKDNYNDSDSNSYDNNNSDSNYNSNDDNKGDITKKIYT